MFDDIKLPQNLSWQELDAFAWKAICSWHLYTDINVVHNNLNFSELTRYFLWDKVPRAIRKQVDPAGFSFEQKLLDKSLANNSIPQPLLKPNLLELIKRPARSIYSWSSLAQLKAHSQLQSLPILYVPVGLARINSTIESLVKSQAMVVAVPYPQFYECAGVHQIRTPRIVVADNELEYAQYLHTGILKGLRGQGIQLLDRDVSLLQNQIIQQIHHIQQVEFDLAAVKPHAILVYADNHYPLQDYVLVARREGIPSIMIQHGLDCDQYCYNEAYTDHIAVWGESRLKRYQKDSTWQPKKIVVTGNPQYDHFCFPDKLETNGDYWLWATRPHSPEKCYLPSRNPHEAIEIFKALLSALQQFPLSRLIIKPHQLDNPEIYRECLTNHHLREQVEITSSHIQPLIAKASLVISEDSTVGLEAMFLGKIVIHAHFANSQPVMPFVEYKAALPAYSAEMLHDSLRRALPLTKVEQENMLQGQRKFLKDYAGSGGGQAHQQFSSFVSSALSSYSNCLTKVSPSLY
jgi:UDP-N-acetylglucosamine 2-epimerase